jgi:hypothetical protein
MSDNIIRVLLKGDSKQLTDALNKAESSLNKLAPKLKNVGRNLTTFVSLPLAGAAAAAIKFASDMEESTNKVDVAFGESSKHVKDFAKTTLESFGIAESSALDMAALFGDFSTSMGLSQEDAAALSTQLVGLAGDLSSFKNVNIEEVTTALSGVFTQETESLKRLGVVMTEANLQQFALSQGITKNIKDFSQAEKVLLRYQFVMNATANAHGDFERTGGGAANQTRAFLQGLKELGAELGQILLPFFTKAVTFANKLIKEFKGLDDSSKILIVFTGAVAAAAPPLLYLAGTVIPAVVSGFKLLGVAVVTAAAPIAILTAGVTGLTLAVQKLLEDVAPGTTFFQTLGNILGNFGNPAGVAAIAMDQIADSAKNAAPKQEALADSTDTLTGSLNNYLDALGKIGTGEYTMPGANAKDTSFEDAMLADANAMAKAVDEMLSTDTDLIYSLATQEAAIEHFGNKIANTAELFRNSTEEITEATNQMTINFESMAQSIGNALSAVVLNGGSAFQALGQLILGTLGDLLVQMGTAAIAASKLAETFAIPIVGAAAGIAAVAIGTMIKGLSSKVQSGGFTAFANGGIVSTPTLGLVGEYAGARQNPEVIAPLDKLKSMIGDRGGNVNVTGQFRLDGQDLVVAVERANNERSNLIG